MDERKKYLIMFIVLLVLAIIDLIVPDPIPFLDEAILSGATLLTGGKMITLNNKNK